MYGMVPSTILTLGTEQHHHFIKELNNGNVRMNKTQRYIIIYYTASYIVIIYCIIFTDILIA